MKRPYPVVATVRRELAEETGLVTPSSISRPVESAPSYSAMSPPMWENVALAWLREELALRKSWRAIVPLW